MRRFGRQSSLWLIIFFLTLYPCCSDSGSAPTATSSGVEVHQRSFSDLPPFNELVVDLRVQLSGTLEVTVDWVSPADDIDVYLTGMSCQSIADHLFTFLSPTPRPCAALARATTSDEKPEMLVHSADPGEYRLWILNYGPGRASGSLDVRLQP